jgi:hypothetical protein
VCICGGGGGGGLRPLGGLHSLFGLWCGERFLLRIILCERGISWRVGVACVERMGKRWTIYSYIVLRLLVCRILFSGLLGWFGSYLGTFFFAWQNWFGRHSSSIWNMFPACLLWILWTERNRLIFEDCESFEGKLLENFVTAWFQWSRAWGFTSSTSLVCFIKDLGFTFVSTSL